MVEHFFVDRYDKIIFKKLVLMLCDGSGFDQEGRLRLDNIE